METLPLQFLYNVPSQITRGTGDQNPFHNVPSVFNVLLFSPKCENPYKFRCPDHIEGIETEQAEDTVQAKLTDKPYIVSMVQYTLLKALPFSVTVKTMLSI